MCSDQSAFSKLEKAGSSIWNEQVWAYASAGHRKWSRGVLELKQEQHPTVAEKAHVGPRVTRALGRASVRAQRRISSLKWLSDADEGKRLYLRCGKRAVCDSYTEPIPPARAHR